MGVETKTGPATLDDAGVHAFAVEIAVQGILREILGVRLDRMTILDTVQRKVAIGKYDIPEEQAPEIRAAAKAFLDGISAGWR